MTLLGKRFLITAGPTRAPLDSVRYISNKSTGRTGALIAEEALRRGGSVTYVHGRPSVLPTIRGVVHDHLTVIAIETVQDLIRTFREELPKGYDVVVHNMAVLDFEPAEIRRGKTGSEDEWGLRLVPTPKAVHLVKDLAPHTYLVAFKLEVGKSRGELVASALELLRKEQVDLVITDIMMPRLDGAELEDNGHTLAQVSQLIMGLTQDQTYKNVHTPAPGRGGDTVFAAALPSSMMSRLPCLPEARAG